MAYGNDGKKGKIAVVAISCIMLVAIVIGVTVGVNKTGTSPSVASPSGEISTTNKAIKSICQPTDYKQTCEDSLNKVAGNTTDPQKLVQAAFQVAISELKNAMNKSATVKELAKDPMAKQALDICQELLDNGVDDLKNSFRALGALDFSTFDEYVANLKVWLSATITYQQTCLDGFENTTGKAGEKMKEILMTSSQLTSNGLAMVTGLSSIVKDLNIPGISHRRLLEAEVVEGFPSWVSASKRKLLQATPATIKPDAVVALDGSGQYRTINEAVKKIPKNRNTTFVLYIKKGVYVEQVTISKSLTHVMMIGDGPTKTKISGNLSVAKGVQTCRTATVSIDGGHFMAKDIGFENTAGAIGRQAVALKVQSDFSIFYNCQMDGHQDTLYPHTNRQFYRDCTISGTVDFIFGNAVAVFQNCKMVVRKPLQTQTCVVTAQGRNETRSPTGFVIHNCTITADPEYYPLRFRNRAYLGRPWREFSRTIVMQSQLDDLIDPEGWSPWRGLFALDTLYYGEYNNRGPGAVQTQRVKWRGIKKITPQQAAGYTASEFLGGDSWIPATGVPYTSGLIKV